LQICNQEEIKIDSEAIGIGERVGEERREEMSEEEGEVSATSPRQVSVLRILTTNSHSKGFSSRLRMET